MIKENAMYRDKLSRKGKIEISVVKYKSNLVLENGQKYKSNRPYNFLTEKNVNECFKK